MVTIVEAVAVAGEEEEISSEKGMEGAIGCVVPVKELENEDGSSIIATVRLVLRLVFSSGLPYEER